MDPSSLFASLRWKAAETLTSILSESERQHLLQKYEQELVMKTTSSKKDEESSTQHSIGEAVIAARAEEAKKQEQRWESQKQEIMKQAEQAAMERVNQDLMIQQRKLALERWKRDLERDEQQEQQSGVVNGRSDVVEITAPEMTTTPQEQNLDDHPVLGKAVVDLGYKRVYMVSSKVLSSIPVYQKQRIYRHDRAKLMASDKQKTPHLGLPGIIALHEDADGRLAILDGQHRVGMMTILQETQDNHGINLDNVLVEVFSHNNNDNNDSDLAQELFTEINKAEPVKLVDMPGVASKSHRNTITEGASKLQQLYPDMFKPSQKCRSPHLNIDNLRDALFASNVLSKHSIKTSKQLLEFMLEQNEVLEKKYSSSDDSKVSASALEKAKKYGFYLGLESSWLYN